MIGTVGSSLEQQNEIGGQDRCVGESAWLTALNPHGLGPQLIHADSHRVVTAFVDGTRILCYLADESSASCRRDAAKELLLQARRLDLLGVQKGEFIRPDRHALVVASGSEGGPRQIKVVLLDFERCRAVSTPKNVAQLCQFLASPRFAAAAAGPPSPTGASGGWRGIDTERLRALVRRYQTAGQTDPDYAAVEALILDAWDLGPAQRPDSPHSSALR